MNTRSLRFQLIVWYASLLSGGFLLIGIATYFALAGYLERDLKGSQLRRARQVAQTLLANLGHQNEAQAAEEIEILHAPGLNNRFVRVTRGDGKVLYVSGLPQDRSFTPGALPSPVWPIRLESARQVALPDGLQMLLAGHTFQVPDGVRYLIEAGAPMNAIRSVLHSWLVFLAVGLPLGMMLAVGGGYFLVKRALSPVDRIIASAQQISSQNLSERLPVAQTGDELERLSVALNHMIERLDAAFQYSRRFMADASHELRTPLTVLRGELESCVQERRLPHELRDRLGSALEEVVRLAAIVEGLFAISRLDAGEAQMEWEQFDLAQLVTSTADQMSLLAEDKSIRVTCTVAPDVQVRGDRQRLKQVVVNLLDNAIKYTPPGGAISLTVHTHDDKAVLEVADNGLGIPPQALPHVFERFYRVDKARSREMGGAGLGLSIVKSICTFHHGRVEVTSTAHQGSRFRVELPCATVPVEPIPAGARIRKGDAPSVVHDS